MCKSYPYKGLIIYENDKGSPFGTKYFSVVNPKKCDKNGKKLHAHAMTKASVHKIADCYDELKRYKFCKRRYSLNIRNKAMKLDGCFIKMIN